MALATTQGKDHALKALEDRRATAKEKGQVDDSALPAGSPMHFYCIGCGCLSDVLPESYTCRPKKICDECAALKELGWLV